VTRSVIVVGAGLTGLYASILAARRGAQVLLVAQGRGGLALSHGCIDVWHDGDVRFSFRNLDPAHPLAGLGMAVFQAALTEFLDIVQEAGLPYAGGLDRPMRLPRALGTIRTTAAAPVTLAAGSLDDKTPIHMADLRGFRDFSANLAAGRLRTQGVPIGGVVELPLAEVGARDAYAHELAGAFDDPGYRAEVCSTWKPLLRGVRRLGLPAVLGTSDPTQVVADLEAGLGVDIFEIPTLPPSLPGLRLERALRHRASSIGVDVVEGPSVRGEIDGRSAGRRVSGVVAATAGGPRAFRADTVLLATGGPAHAGWMSFANGEVQDSVFGLPVDAPDDREAWTSPDPFESQPYARFGLRLDSRRHPCDRRGRPYFENLFAAGGLLAGADRTLEGSRQVIDLATAFAAVEAMLR